MIIDHLEEHFGKMTVTRGKEHMLLGMKIHYTKSQTAVLSMKSYLEEAIKECFMNFMQKVATPVKQMLFEMGALNEEEGKLFHRIVAKLLNVSIWARADILLPVRFLCTRVSKAQSRIRQG